MAANASQCNARAVARLLDWTSRPLPALLAGDDAFDVVLAADCVYRQAPLDALVDVLAHYAGTRSLLFFVKYFYCCRLLLTVMCDFVCLRNEAPRDAVVLVTCEEHEPTALQVCAIVICFWLIVLL